MRAQRLGARPPGQPVNRSSNLVIATVSLVVAVILTSIFTLGLQRNQFGHEHAITTTSTAAPAATLLSTGAASRAVGPKTIEDTPPLNSLRLWGGSARGGPPGYSAPIHLRHEAAHANAAQRGGAPPEAPARPTPGITLTVSVITNDRFDSLRRLCESLVRVKHDPNRSIIQDINVVFNLEAKTRHSTAAYLHGLEWHFGTVTVKKRIRQGGLIAAVMESWYPSHMQEFGLILEDDIEVSEHAFMWIETVLEAYLRDPDPHMAGISLYSPRCVCAVCAVCAVRRSVVGCVACSRLCCAYLYVRFM